MPPLSVDSAAGVGHDEVVGPVERQVGHRTRRLAPVRVGDTGDRCGGGDHLTQLADEHGAEEAAVRQSRRVDAVAVDTDVGGDTVEQVDDELHVVAFVGVELRELPGRPAVELGRATGRLHGAEALGLGEGVEPAHPRLLRAVRADAVKVEYDR